MTKESAIEKPATFTDGQKAYITEQRVLRIATVPDDQALDVASVAFRFDGEKFHIGGIDVKSTFKYRNVRANGRTARVVDDLKSVDPCGLAGSRSTAEAWS